MSGPLSRELERTAPPRGSLPLHRDSDRPLTVYYRLAGVVQDISGWVPDSPRLWLANSLTDTSSFVEVVGSIAANQIAIPLARTHLTDLNTAGVWQLHANNGSGQVVLAYGDQVGDLTIIEGVN